MKSRPKNIGLLAIVTKKEKFQVPQLCYIFNGAQKEFNFIIEKRLEIPDEQKCLDRKSLIDLAKQNVNMDQRDLLFVIHAFKDDYNWFSTNPIDRISLCSIYDWAGLSTEIHAIFSVGSSIIQILETIEVFKEDKMRYKTTQHFFEEVFRKHEEKQKISPEDMQLIHFKTKGCLNDFCSEKKDKLFRILTGHVCKECIKIWEKSLDSEIINALFEMIEALRIRLVVDKNGVRTRTYCRDLVTHIEKHLHEIIFQKLEKMYSKKWWTEGISKEVRKKISYLFEDNDCVGEKHDYTNICDLKDIWTYKPNWSSFSTESPFKAWTNKKEVKKDFTRLIKIRNNLMHSTRNDVPSSNDKDFLEEFEQKVFSLE